MEEVSKASRQGVQKKEAPTGRACRVTPSTALLPSHLDDLYRRTGSCLEETQRNGIAESFTEFTDVFAHSANDLGRTSIVKHEICINNSNPDRQNARCLPINQQAVAEAEIVNMLKPGVIKPSSSPWTYPTVLVCKKDGTTGFCVDFCKLSFAMVKDSYPFLHIDDSINALSRS